MNRSSLLAALAEFGPLVAFFIAGQYTNFFTAVAILMTTTVMAVLLSWQLDRRIPWLPIISAVFVLGGGAITLYWQAPDAVIFADTLYYCFIGISLAVSLFRRSLILKKMFGTIFAISDEGWRLLTWRWCIFLLCAALANEAARALLTPDNWIHYRFYKSIIVVLFACYQITLSRKYRLPNQSTKWGIRNVPLQPVAVPASNDIQKDTIKPQ